MSLSVVEDVTEQNRVEAELKRKTEEQELLLENIDTQIWYLMDEENYGAVNKAHAVFLGLEKEHLERKCLYSFLSKEEAAVCITGNKEVFRQRKQIRTEEWLKNSQGETRLLAITKTPKLDAGGNVEYVICAAQDITERKVMENELIEHQNHLEELVVERTNELKALNKQLLREISERKLTDEMLRQAQRLESIGILTVGIAHDFNNILTAILNYTELMIEDTPAGNKIAINLQQVLKATHRAKELVNQILVFSRRCEQPHNPVHLTPIIMEVLGLLRATLAHDIILRHNIETVKDTVWANPSQIHQILMNLSLNAAHAMREGGGVLQVNIAGVDIDPQEEPDYTYPGLNPGSYLKITVSDTGHGIEPNILSKIFEPFFTTKGVGEGTGMGLAVAYEIVTGLGGGITVSSEPGHGSRFSVYLPRAGDVIVLAEEGQTSKLEGRSRLLLVDDEESIIQVSRLLLRQLGYEAWATTSSEEALEIFKAAPECFDLVVTDLDMPKMSGEELSQELLKIRPNLPIILCTGFSYSISAERAKSIGIREIIMKPFAVRELAYVIKRLID